MKRPTGKLWLDTFFARKSMSKFPNKDLAGKTIVFTGGTDGMGRVAIMRFAEMGANILLLGRNPEKMSSVVNECRTAGYPGTISTVECDLSSLEQVRHAATEVLKQCEKIDFLINCAGANIGSYQLSKDGNEMNFAVNYLGPFLLTELLLERLKATDTARIINVVSGTQAVADLDFTDLQHEKDWSLLKSYGRAKLCGIMYSRDLASRLNGSGVTVNSLNPGYIKTNLTHDVQATLERAFNKLFSKLAAPAWVGGERIIAASLDEKMKEASGQFIYEDILLQPNKIALDNNLVSQLMEVSRDLTA